MSRSLCNVLGLAEIAVGVALLLLGLSLPGRDEVRDGFDGARRVTASAGEQVQALRDQVEAVRRSELHRTAEHLREATGQLATTLRASRVDFEAIRSVRDATARAADGLDALAAAVDPEALAGLGDALGDAADFLDGEVIPAAGRAAATLDAGSDRLGEGARRFARALEQAPPDLGPVQEVHDGLARLDDGLAALHATLDPARLAGMRQAADGAEGVVSEAARLAERAAGYTYPVVTLDGLRPRVDQRPFWPRGAEVGADMRRVAAGVAAMDRELGMLARDLPRVREAVEGSRTSVAATREALAGALDRREEVERLLGEMPAQAAALAEELPRLAGELAKALRGVETMQGLADSLRLTSRGVEGAAARWPEVRGSLTGSATLVRAASDQLDRVIEHRPEYEAAMGRVEAISGEVAEWAPTLADGLALRLDQEDRILAEMARGLAQVGEALPAYSTALERGLAIGRPLAWLVAALAGLHGCSLLAGGLASRHGRGSDEAGREPSAPAREG